MEITRFFLTRFLSPLINAYMRMPGYLRFITIFFLTLKYVILLWLLLKGTGVFSFAFAKEEPVYSYKTGFVNWERIQKVHPSWEHLQALNKEIETINNKIGQAKESLKRSAEIVIDITKSVINPVKPFSSSPNENKEDGKALEESVKLLASFDFNEAAGFINKNLSRQIESQRRQLESSFQLFSKTVIEEGKQEFQLKREVINEEIVEAIKKKEQVLKQDFIEYQAVVLKQNQNKKLNLQLKLMVAKTPEERTNVETQLNYIVGDEELLMRAKVEENQHMIETFKNEQEIKAVDELKRFKSKISNQTRIRQNKRKEELRNAFEAFLKANTSLSVSKISSLKAQLFGKSPSLYNKNKKVNSHNVKGPLNNLLQSAKEFPNMSAGMEKNLQKEKNLVLTKNQELALKFKAEEEKQVNLLYKQLILLKEQKKRLVNQINRELNDYLKQASIKYNMPVVTQKPVMQNTYDAKKIIDLTSEVISYIKKSAP